MKISRYFRFWFKITCKTKVKITKLVKYRYAVMRVILIRTIDLENQKILLRQMKSN